MNKTKWLLVGLLGLALAVGAYRFFLGGPWDRHIAAGSVAYEQGDYAKAEEEWMAALAEAEAFGRRTLASPRPSTNWRCSIISRASTPRPSRFTSAHWQSTRRLLAPAIRT